MSSPKSPPLPSRPTGKGLRQQVTSPESPVVRPLGREQLLLSPESPVVRPLVGKEPLPSPRKSQAPTVNISPPDLSDSDPDDNYCNYRFALESGTAKKERRRSKSSSTTSSRNSSIGEEVGKRPVATPRKNKSMSQSSASDRSPPLRTVSLENIPSQHRTDEQQQQQQQQGDREASGPRPPLPPRPHDIPKITKHQSIEEPSRPKQRPRMSEIKRAKDRARAGNPVKGGKNGAPSLSVVNEDGSETMSVVSSKSSKSSNSYTSSKSAPAGVGGAGGAEKAVGKRRTSTEDRSAAAFLVPERPYHQQRRKSASDEVPSQGLVRPSLPSSSSSPSFAPSSLPTGTGEGLANAGLPGGAAGGLNTQVADSLLKYIMSSDDPKLKAALRELIVQDTHVTESLHQ